MIQLDATQEQFSAQLEAILQRASDHSAIEQSVRAILDDVREHGDAALVRYAETFDHVHFDSVDNMRVKMPSLRALKRQLKPAEIIAIDTAYEHVTQFAAERLPQNWSKRFREQVHMGEVFRPLDRVGVYIPGGTAPLVSTIIHTAAIAHCAGVKEIVGVTPPARDGSLSPQMLYAFYRCGVKEIYAMGGVYAIGALAYGTETVRRVQKIVGPGNAYVTAAKKFVYGDVAIDMVAGPSEVMVVADASANATYVAADLFSQLEHGGGNLAVLATNDKRLLTEVPKALEKLLGRLSRKKMLEEGLRNGAVLIYAPDLKACVRIANRVAPEHLELSVRNPHSLVPFVTSAGALFLGHYTPEPVGDFVAGPSHVLPTGGSANYFSGLSVESFFRRISVNAYGRKALQREVGHICTFAQMEGLDAHGLSASIRFETENEQ